MGTAEVDIARRPGWRSRCFPILRELGGYLLIPTVLTVFFTVFGNMREPRIVALMWCVNLMFTVGIGGSITFLYRRSDSLFRRWSATWQHILLHTAIASTGVGIGVEIVVRATPLLPGQPTVPRFGAYQVAVVVTLVMVLIALSAGRSASLRQRAEREAEVLRREALQARLEALQARTNPHFLFNSLNTVAGLIDQDPERAESVVEKLASLFRYSLESSKKDLVPLEHELEFCRDYVEIEKIRLGDRLQSRFEIDPVGEVSVPPLLLQPLIENAILHGISQRRAGGELEVRVKKTGDRLIMTVLDDGDGPREGEHVGTQTSVRELRERLDLLYGNTARADVVAGPGYTVKIDLPFVPDSEVGLR